MRVREWYSWHFPELVKIISDNYMYARLVRLIRKRESLTAANLHEVEAVCMDATKAQEVRPLSRPPGRPPPARPPPSHLARVDSGSAPRPAQPPRRGRLALFCSGRRRPPPVSTEVMWWREQEQAER